MRHITKRDRKYVFKEGTALRKTDRRDRETHRQSNAKLKHTVPRRVRPLLINN